MVQWYSTGLQCRRLQVRACSVLFVLWIGRIFPTSSENVYLSEYFILPRNRTSSEKAYLPITMVVLINCDSRQNIRLLCSLICGIRPGCRTFQSTFLQCTLNGFLLICDHQYSGRGKFMPLSLKSKILETPGFLVTDYIKMFPLWIRTLNLQASLMVQCQLSSICNYSATCPKSKQT